MDKTEWKEKIIAALDEIGMNRPEFTLIVGTLAEIMEQRDNAFKEFVDSGASICITKTSDRGAKNLAKNPFLSVWLDLNNIALMYWKELCLSPASLKKLSLEAQRGAENGSILEALLAKLTNE